MDSSDEMDCTSSEYDNGDIFGHKEEASNSEEESNSEENEDSEGEDSCEESEDSEGVDSDEDDPWGELIDEAATELRTEYEAHVESLKNDGISEIDAKTQAFSEILPKLRKELGNVYSDRLEWMAQMKNDPVHKKIMETRKRLIEDDSFDKEEALTAAINKRKFLLERLLKERQHIPEDEDNTDLES